MRLDIKAFALACGIVWGLAVLVGTLWLIVSGSGGTVVRYLDKFYIGYSFSVIGAFIGAIWGFVDGFIGGAIFAWIYNKVAKAD